MEDFMQRSDLKGSKAGWISSLMNLDTCSEDNKRGR